ncbi:uncharacterized protein LOC132551553 [Ylistrum balloti]|uniref:uncharacterized protein LOC132551553 n=1 Tax=Ylistrum balloti TaxID=509963 RepID=UPI0029058E62|nr:uncharacterized protein LOC132551553 [Ylistrum balloti]
MSATQRCIKSAELSNLDKRPLFVLGIFSADLHIEYRNALRSTWLSTVNLLQDTLPFRIKYKFLLDNQTEDAMLENSKYNDILFLNVTVKGRAVRFGEKLYVWYKYVHEKYPSVTLIAKLDDDTFLCVPQIFKRLDELKSQTLYYGWTHFAREKLNAKQFYLDEMFVVVGKKLIDRIVKRNYCTDQKGCNASIDLIETNYADTSLVSWLSIYNDIDYVADNKIIFQMGRGHEATILLNIKPGFCTRYILNHKSSVDVMKQLHKYNTPETFSNVGPIGSVTGSLFSGGIVRTLLPTSITNKYKYLAMLDKMPECNNWAVVTTIHSPSKAVKTIASLSNWCLVIVADNLTPLEGTYLQGLGFDKARNRIKYLSVKEQSKLYPLLSEIIPNNHFGRKNIGYMYAIHHKAKHIWDFDDDNNGMIKLNDFKMKTHFHYVTVCKGVENILLNPYTYFGVEETYTWPRGFPLQDIRNETTKPKLCNSSDTLNLGIVQSLANNQPDIDAIYRLTRDAPFDFRATRKSHLSLVLPKYSYAPFNAQATLWLPPAFPYLALPISVNGRVSDIWRSYIAQFFLHRKDIRLAFSPPYVTQERNAHNILKDFNAELDLYHKSKELVDFLSSEKSGNLTDIVDLYKSLYMREYIEQFDIQFAEAWKMTLASIGQVI